MRALTLILAFLAAIIGGAAPAQSAGRNHIAASLVAETVSPVPGKTVQIAIRMVPEPGWHGYWSNPGDSGVPTTVSWSAPAGVSFGPLRHPAPTMLEAAGFASYVHAGTHSLMTTMKLPSGLALGTAIPVTAELNWLACSESLCVPEKATLSLALSAGNGETSDAGRAIVRSGLSALPKALAKAGTMYLDDGAIVITVPIAADPARARLYPEDDRVFAAAARQQVRRAGEGLEFRIATEAAAIPSRFNFVLRAGDRSYSVRASASRPAARSAAALATPDGEGVSAAARRSRPAGEAGSPSVARASDPVHPGPTAMAAAASYPLGGLAAAAAAQNAAGAGSFLMVLILAFAVGLILNVMPCVFPILSLKALSLARLGGSDSAARREALAFTAGTILVCLGLGAVLLVLKAAGMEAGWSFQLQSPYVVLGLLVLTTAITLNLAGLFELPGIAIDGALGSKPGMAGSFWTGVFAAFVATPCSGPFMAGAIGAAMILPAPAALAIFAGLGLGMAAPFLAIGFIPALSRRLPKPGPWMAAFRQVLAIPMLLTALALAWLLGRQTGVDGMALGIAAALLVAVALWWIGARQRRGRQRNWTILAPAVAIAAVLMVRIPAAPVAAAPIAETSSTQAFSEARLAALRAKGVPVFVDFTADWCLSCKVNEKAAIDTDQTQRAFRAAGVVTLVGDWTRGDPAITRFLASHGRNSIPYYLFYAPGREPEVLPQLLTPGALSALARRSAATS